MKEKLFTILSILFATSLVIVIGYFFPYQLLALLFVLTFMVCIELLPGLLALVFLGVVMLCKKVVK